MATRNANDDFWADIVIGQPNFNTVTRISPPRGDRLYNPNGCVIDTGASPPILYILDGGHNRILGYEWPGYALFVAAPVIIIGQPDESSSGANGDGAWEDSLNYVPPTANTLNIVWPGTRSPGEAGIGSQLTLDGQRNLWVCDGSNHRALRYPLVDNVRSTTPDRVIGQANYTSGQANRGNGTSSCAANTLFFSWNVDEISNAMNPGIAVDLATGDLWISDNGNHRLLRYAAADIATGGDISATQVIGQANMTSRTYTTPATPANSTSLSKVGGPMGIAFNSDGTKMYVADPTYNRIIVFTKTGGVWGSTGALFASGVSWNRPTVVATNQTWYPDQVIVVDSPGSGSPTRMVYILNQSDGSVVKRRGDLNSGNEGIGGSIGIDDSGDLVIPIMRGAYQMQCVVFRKSEQDSAPDTFYLKFDATIGLGSGKGFDTLRGVAVSNHQLIVADYGRILFWNDLDSLTNGKTASGYLSGMTVGFEGSFTNRDTNCNDLFCIAVDGSRTHLWVGTASSEGQSGQLLCYNLPLTTAQQPNVRLSGNINLLGGGTIYPFGGWSVAPNYDSSEVWISQTLSHRAVRIKNPLTSPIVDMIVGQDNATDRYPNKGVKYSYPSPDLGEITWTSSYFQDTRRSWTDNELAGGMITVTDGNNIIRGRLIITSNTGTRANGTWDWDFPYPSTTVQTYGYNASKAAVHSSLYFPGYAHLDSSNRLWISDHALEAQGNAKLAIYNKTTIPSNNSALVTGPEPDYIYPNIAMWKVAIGPQGQLVVGYNNYSVGSASAPDYLKPEYTAAQNAYMAEELQGRYIGIYYNPLDSSKFTNKVRNQTTVNYPNPGTLKDSVPDDYLDDYYSMVTYPTFDYRWNLYVGDGNRNLVRIYKKPFGDGPENKLKKQIFARGG